MSLFSNPEAVPSRIIGAWRYLAMDAGDDVLDAVLKQDLMPDTVLPDRKGDRRGVLTQSLKAGVEIGLFGSSGGEDLSRVRLAPDASTVDPAEDEVCRDVLADLLLDSDNGNDGFVIALAWFLCQSPFGRPLRDKEPPTLPGNIQEAGLQDRTGITSDASSGAFRHWSTYLGFANSHKLDGKTAVSPDPTRYLSGRLPQIVEATGERVPLLEVMRRLSQRCPVLEGGAYRDEIETLLDVSRPERHLSETTSLALLRLADRGEIDLYEESDAANVLVLQKGNQSIRYSHFILTDSSR